MPQPLIDRYDALVQAGEIERDPAQVAVVGRMATLADRLAEHRLARKSSPLGWLFGRRETQAAPLKGLYVWGEVGRGKTMLMDLFFEAATPTRKRRAHFYTFMADVHQRIHAARRAIAAGEIKGDDPIAPVAEALAAEAWLLCFDEFHVTDITDAMILGRLFTQLFGHGVVMVATSNMPPERLYENGLNRPLFTPFLDLLGRHVDVMRLDARTDFRREKLGGQPIWIVPSAEAGPALDEAFGRLAGGRAPTAIDLPLMGRSLHVPRAANGVARFTFADLCEAPLGPADYLALAQAFHTVIVEHIPVLRAEMRNPTRRFIMLVDTLYDHGVKLVASADAEPADLCPEADGYERFAFERTVSRLVEMRSDDYLALPHGRRDRGPGGESGLVET